MQLKFRIILNVEEDVLRDIITDSNLTLIEFSKIISSEFGFDSSEISTFHHSNENWEQLDEIKICVEYDLNGKKIDYLPAASEDQFNIKPVYKTFPGWKSKTQGIRNLKDLPDNAKKYIHAIEDFIGARISSISTSPERDDTILVEDPFNN